MKTIKDILTENRDSVISSIKFMYKVYRVEDIKPIMVRFLSYCETYVNAEQIEMLENSKRVKTDLKDILAHMSISEKREITKANNLRMYGTEKPKLADLIAYGHEDEKYDILKKEWIKY